MPKSANFLYKKAESAKLLSIKLAAAALKTLETEERVHKTGDRRCELVDMRLKIGDMIQGTGDWRR